MPMVRMPRPKQPGRQAGWPPAARPRYVMIFYDGHSGVVTLPGVIPPHPAWVRHGVRPEGRLRNVTEPGRAVASAFRLVPGLQAVTSYQRAWLAKDIVAGVVLTTLLVPQGMAYAELAGLPPITGLYTSILCLLGYAVFGPSRILVLGPDSSLGPMIAATILPLIAANGDAARAIALASMLALIV